VSVNPIAPALFQGGQMTDLPAFTGTLNGTELMEIVAAGAGQSLVQNGVNYGITTQQLALLLNAISLVPVIIVNGQYNSPANPFTPGPFNARIYLNKSIAEATYIKFAGSTTYIVEPLIEDIAGTLDGVTGICTVSFTGETTTSGLATVPIATPFGGFFFRPVGLLGKWALGSA